MALKRDVAAGLAWTSASTFGRRILALAANIALARLLAPSDFGLVAMAAVVIGLVDVFKDLGTGAALIQRDRVDEVLLSSLFWFNAAFGIAASATLIACAPLVAALYGEPRVAPIVLGLAASILLSSLAIVQNSLLQREFRFAMLAKIELASTAASYIVAVSAALLGAGAWSLVCLVLTNTGVFLVLAWRASSWRPRWRFAPSALRPVMRYSLNLASYNVFFYLAQNVDNLLIGRYLGSESLGWYDLAYRLMTFPMQAISAVFGKVMLPLYARLQDDMAQFRRAFIRVAGAIAFVTFPMMLGLLAAREAFVLAVFGAQWAPVIALLAVFAPIAALRSVQTTTGSIFMATGRTGLQLAWGVVSNVLVIGAIVVGLQWGLQGVAIGYSLATLALAYPGFAIALRLIGMRVGDLASSLTRTAACSVAMLAMVHLAGMALVDQAGAWTILGVQVATGLAAYGAMTWLINRPLLRDFLTSAGLTRAAP